MHGEYSTLSLAWSSRSFRRASTWMCELTCFRVLVFPVLSLMYLAISSFRPATRRETTTSEKKKGGKEIHFWALDLN